jgi:putative transposase
MKLLTYLLSFIVLFFRLLSPGGVRAVAAENVALRKQLIVLARRQKRAPKLTTFDRIIFGMLAIMIRPKRLSRISIILKPATFLRFHKALVQRKYHLLFSNKTSKKSGQKGPEQALIDAIVEMKRRNPRYGCRRIAMQISNAFGVEINKDVVRRILNKYCKNSPKDGGPSWLTFIGHMKDSLWSVDLFRAESLQIKSHWVMLIMDQFSRRIIGFAVHKGDVSGVDLCCMFNKIISSKVLPKYLSSDNDPLFLFERWKANLRILEIEQVKSIPYIPISHPFVERLIGSVRRELLDQTLFWNTGDLEKKLQDYQKYFNEDRCHLGISGVTPLQKSVEKSAVVLNINDYRWENRCRGLFQLPIAA